MEWRDTRCARPCWTETITNLHIGYGNSLFESQFVESSPLCASHDVFDPLSHQALPCLDDQPTRDDFCMDLASNLQGKKPQGVTNDQFQPTTSQTQASLPHLTSSGHIHADMPIDIKGDRIRTPSYDGSGSGSGGMIYAESRGSLSRSNSEIGGRTPSGSHTSGSVFHKQVSTSYSQQNEGGRKAFSAATDGNRSYSHRLSLKRRRKREHRQQETDPSSSSSKRPIKYSPYPIHSTTPNSSRHDSLRRPPVPVYSTPVRLIRATRGERDHRPDGRGPTSPSLSDGERDGSLDPSPLSQSSIPLPRTLVNPSLYPNISILRRSIQAITVQHNAELSQSLYQQPTEGFP